MPGLEAGMVCVKTHGKEAGKKCIVVEFDKKAGMAVVEGPFVKKRKCNPKHLMPLGKKVSYKKGMKKEEIAKLVK